MKFLVFVKQIPDPDIPPAQFRIDTEKNTVAPPQGSSPAVSTYDELAVEAALRLRDDVGGEVTVVSLNNNPVMNVIKKPLAMGSDNLILLQDDAFEGGDAMTTARVLAAAAKKIEFAVAKLVTGIMVKWARMLQKCWVFRLLLTAVNSR